MNIEEKLDVKKYENVSTNCKTFISKLLIKDPYKRLGNKDTIDLLEHQWLKGMKRKYDPKKLQNKKLSPD